MFKRESLIERLARQSGWLIVEREGDFYMVRDCTNTSMRYIKIRACDQWHHVQFQTDLPIKIPMAFAPPELYRLMLVRNQVSRYGHWNMDVQGSCEACLFVSYVAIKIGLTPETFDAVCRDLLKEREAVHDQFRGHLSGLLMPQIPAVSAVPQGQMLPPGGNVPQITWLDA